MVKTCPLQRLTASDVFVLRQARVPKVHHAFADGSAAFAAFRTLLDLRPPRRPTPGSAAVDADPIPTAPELA